MFEAGESLILSSIFFLYLLRYIAIFLVYDTVGIGGVLGGDDTCIWHGVFFFFFLDNLEYTKQCDICIIIYVYVIEQFILVVLIIRSLYNHTPEAPRS